MNPKFKLPEFDKDLVNELCSLCDIIESKLNAKEDASKELSIFNSKVIRIPDPMEFTTYYGSTDSEEFVTAMLFPVIKDDSISPDDYISLIEAVMNCEGSGLEMDYWIQILQDNLSSQIIDFIYHTEEELSASEIYAKAKTADSDSIILL